MPGEPAFEVLIEAKNYPAADRGLRAVLRHVTFGAGAGEVLALFGPSGTGKTTTLRIVLGLDTDFSGTVRRPEGRTSVVFQEPRLVPWLSILDNLRLVLPRGAPEPDIPRLMALLGLPGIEARFPRELSLGMARRTALARALVVVPSLLVLDEPFASLDPLLAAQLADIVRRLAREAGTTVLLATHELDQALSVATRVLVLSGDPATLAADRPVPDRADAAGMAVLREELRARFPFFGASNPDAG
jgi:NitT/TauT family transport system ATP-binding protein